MRKLALILFILAGTVILISALASTDESASSPVTPQHAEALTAVLAEVKVNDATITEAGVLYAGIADDGSDRTGYAEYLCGLVGQYHTDVRRVVVVAHGTQKHPRRDNAYGIHLGNARCD